MTVWKTDVLSFKFYSFISFSYSGHFYKTKQEYMDQVKFLCNEENFTTWNIDIKNYNQLRFVQNAEYDSRKNVYL